MSRRALIYCAIVFALVSGATFLVVRSMAPIRQPPVTPPGPPTSVVTPTATPPGTPTVPPSLPTTPIVPAMPGVPATPSASTTLDKIAKLSNTQHGWGLSLNTTHKVPGVASATKSLLAGHDAAYHVATSSKVVYLTMDQGYENGYTADILDTLMTDGVKAVFFCTGTYIRDNGALVKRMVAEGHVVANHTWDHPNMVTKAKGFSAYRREITSVETEFHSLTGRTLAKVVRMPSGNWSERCLAYNDFLGYRTWFWSFAYRDWETANQPDPVEATTLILANTHPGEILLLHAVSKTNRDILHDVITGIRGQGYVFELPPD